MVFSLRLREKCLDKLREVLHNINMMLISAKEKLVELRELYPNLTEASAKIILEHPMLWGWYEMISGGMKAGVWAVERARRALPRGFYCGTFDSTIKSDYFSVKSNRKGAKRTWDHWISPQSFAEVMFNGWDFYCDINEFLAAGKMCSYTIRVTPEENRALRALTFKNENKEHRVKCSIIERYDHVGIKLKKVGVRGVVPFPFSPGPMFLEAEKSIIERV